LRTLESGCGVLNGYLVETTDWVHWDVVGGFVIVGITVARISDCGEVERNCVGVEGDCGKSVL